jgi:hypothetical protein
MKQKCFYCKEEDGVDFKNQISGELHPACNNCQQLIVKLSIQRRNFKKWMNLRYYGVPFFFISGVISLILNSWLVGFFLITLAMLSGVMSYLKCELFVHKEETSENLQAAEHMQLYK